MKKTRTLLNSVLLSGYCLLVTGLWAANPDSSANQKPTPSRQTSFEQVTSRLAPGGNLYLYLSTESWWTGLEEQWVLLRDVVGQISEEEGEAATVAEAMDLVARLYIGSGIRNISGIGMSSVPIENGLYDNRILVHHYPGAGDGRIWSLFGTTPHPLAGLDLLPSSTQLAWFGDMDVKQLWKWITGELLATDIPALRQGMAQFAHSMIENGINLDAFLDSLGGEFGLAVTLDPAETITFGEDPGGLSFPLPGLLLAVRTNDNTIHAKLVEMLAQQEGFTQGTKNGATLLTGPLLPIPVPVQPVFAQTPDYLLIASHPDLLDAVLAVKAGAPGLASTDEFKQLSQGLPEQGNEFMFVGSGFGDTLKNIQQQSLAMDGSVPPAVQGVLQKMMGAGAPLQAYGVTQNTDEGCYHISRSSVSAGQVALMQTAVAPSAIMAAMLLPAVARARDTAEAVACMNNLKQLGLGIMIYANDHDDNLPEPAGAEGLAKITEYTMGTAVMVCPGHGIEPPDPAAMNEDNISYVYLGGPKISRMQNPTTLPLAFDRPGNHDNRVNVLFADGHVEALTGEFSSCMGIIETLNEQCAYPEDQLRVLRDKAAHFDGH